MRNGSVTALFRSPKTTTPALWAGVAIHSHRSITQACDDRSPDADLNLPVDHDACLTAHHR